MAFIWNDEEAKLVGPGEDWDKSEYVVVRKLFVELNEPDENDDEKEEDVKQLTETALHNKFKKYGPIESIQLFKQRINNNKKYAYLQFVQSKDAYLAYLDNQKKWSTPIYPAYLVIPADTWHQPKSHESSLDDVNEFKDTKMKTSDAITFDQLNDDCLIRIFSYCDERALVNLYEVNKLFNGILCQEILPRHRKLTFNLDRGHEYHKRTDMNLALLRRYIRCFGPYLTEIEFIFHYNNKPSNICRIFNKFAQYTGPYLKKLRLYELVLQEKHLTELNPVLRQLEYLKITAYNEDFEHDIDFRSFCPNLKTLKLLHFMQFVHCSEPWPTLENLSVTRNEYLEIETNRLFMHNNSQLRRLKITAFSSDVLLQNLSCYLTNLEKLTLYQGFPDISANNLVYLINLEKMHTLKLMYLDETAFDGILEFLPKLKGLQKLKLHLFGDGPSDEPHFSAKNGLIINLAQELINLRVFHISFIHLNQDMVIEFIRFAEKLEEFAMHHCDVSLNEKFIYNILDARKHLKSVQPKPLQLIVDRFENLEIEKLLKCPETSKFIKIKVCSGCSLSES